MGDEGLSRVIRASSLSGSGYSRLRCEGPEERGVAMQSEGKATPASDGEQDVFEDAREEPSAVEAGKLSPPAECDFPETGNPDIQLIHSSAVSDLCIERQ